ncbi:MAG: NAD(P)H-hydrate epimerase [Anaerolineales bacterium]
MNKWLSLTLTAEQMAAVDAHALNAYGIQLMQMMENAGRQLASLATDMLGSSIAEKRVFILCGQGNNGGGGMTAARHFHNLGVEVQVRLVADPEALKVVPRLQWETVSTLGLVTESQELPPVSLIIDALLGYNGKGDPRPPISAWIERANRSGIPILSLDIPSGLDASTGLPGSPCIKATTTLTLAAPKTGLFADSAKGYVGELFLADIGIPPQVYWSLFPNLKEFPFFSSQVPIKILDG